MISLEVAEKLGPLTQLVEALEGPGRLGASEYMGVYVQDTIVGHLLELAQTRHDTAQRLGASPTGFIAQAAEAAADSSAVTADADGVAIRIRHPVVARAYRSITIVPRTAKMLAIPLHAIAYGRRAAQLWDSHQLYIRGNRILMPQGEGQEPLALYALVRSVTQQQDRSLMPSDDELATAAADGIRSYLRTSLS